MCDPTKTTSVTRTLKNNTKITVPCPLAVRNYNRFMGGVGYSDQLRKYYHFRLKSRKFYKYIFWFLVELCIVNTYIMCKDHTDLTKTNLKEFRSKLATDLIGSYCSRKRCGKCSSIKAFLSHRTLAHSRCRTLTPLPLLPDTPVTKERKCVEVSTVQCVSLP